MVVKRNRELLTGGKKYAQQAKKKHGVEEVVFDKESRKEYLTGFHKRKLQRQKKAQEYIKEQERLARIQERKEMREERKKDLENQLNQFNQTVKKITQLDDSSDDEDVDSNKSHPSQDEEWSGFASQDQDEDENSSESSSDDNDTSKTPLKGILHRKEVYKVNHEELLPQTNAIIDEETTVTVESLDNLHIVSAQQANLEAIARANNVNLAQSDQVLAKSITRAKNYAVVCGVAKPERKTKKKFRYLSKAERRENVRKERAKGKSKGKK